jgi:hypothetical protein
MEVKDEGHEVGRLVRQQDGGGLPGLQGLGFRV